MAATLDRYPVHGQPLVRGDPWAIVINIVTDDDIAEWEWVASLRETPDSDPATEFLITVNTGTKQLVLHATPEQTRLLAEGYGFDLAQTAPIVRTWLIVRFLDMEKDYSHA